MARRGRFSQYLKNARIERGLSVADVADRIGVSATCVYLWEQGRTRPREANLVALCKALRLPITAARSMAGN